LWKTFSKMHLNDVKTGANVSLSMTNISSYYYYNLAKTFAV